MASNKPKPCRLRPRALDDLEAIWLYTAKQWSVDQADIYIRQLTAGLDLLSKQPEIARERPELTPPVRVHPVGSHVIIPVFPKDRYGVVRNQFVTDTLTKTLYAGYVEAPDWGVSLRKGQHEGLISFETFERIQKRLKEGARAPARPDLNADFPLRGAITCACCERPLTVT